MDKKREWETEYAKRYAEFFDYQNRLLYNRIKLAEEEKRRSEVAPRRFVKLFRSLFRSLT